MSILSWFKSTPIGQRLTRWKELGSYHSTFSSFGQDIYKSDIVRSCIRPLADHTSKANVKCSVKSIEKLLDLKPNMYMSGRDFLYKVRTMYEARNNAIIYIQRDSKGNPIGFYPLPYTRFEAMDYKGRLYIKFYFEGELSKELTLAWEDIAIIRKDYYKSDVCGEDNNAILEMLELINTTNQGVANAVKATANLRGILKSTKAMLKSEDIKKQKEDFVKDYLSLENEGGIASLDATQEFIPITMSPTVTNYEQMKEFRENVYRYFGVNDSIIMSDYKEQQMEAFYSSKIEPFLVALSQELTRKVFTDRQLGFDNYIIYEANKLQFSSMSTKISIFKEVVLYGGMTINEWRAGCTMAPIEGGDKPIRRLDADVIGNTQESEDEDAENEQ